MIATTPLGLVVTVESGAQSSLATRRDLQEGDVLLFVAENTVNVDAPRVPTGNAIAPAESR